MTNSSSSNDGIDLAQHLGSLADDASGLSALLNASHAEGGDIHPEALARAAKLETSLRQVIHALGHHDHLAMDADDIWHALDVEHHGREINPE